MAGLTDKENDDSLMAREAREAPAQIAYQLEQNRELVVKICQKVREFAPQMVMIVGRGSSDHAGVFAKYLIEIESGIPTFAAAPSIATIYNKPLRLSNCLVIVISQSGRSPDILEQTRQAKAAGAMTIALLNEQSAPLAELVDCVIPLHAGEEKSVAATKSYLATLSALLQLVAYWQQDDNLIDALATIPAALMAAIEGPGQFSQVDLDQVKNLVVLGRGLGYAVSKEIALKLKEVCAIHAEAFSSAEFLHGPVTLVENRIKVIDVAVNDESLESHNEQVNEIISRGGDLIHFNQLNPSLHPRVAPLTILQRFYLDVERIARDKGFDPDCPSGLKKVTETI